MHVITPFDTLDSLSAAYSVPACMILRKNRLYSPAWLTPGREIEIPEERFCQCCDFPCPTGAIMRPAQRPDDPP